MVAASVLLLTLAALFSFAPRKAKPSEMTGKAIAVLPFKTVASDGKETFEVSLADALITRLTKVKRLSVKPTSAILVYADRSPDPIAAGRELGVDAIMQGTLQQVGEQVRLTVQMVRVEDGKPIWADHFDARGSDYFALQDALAEQVLEEINEQLTISE
jgi:TolB-like protein